MDTTDPEIRFDENGYCNNCTSFLQKAPVRLVDESKREDLLKAMVRQMKKEGRSRKYDCIIGLSGGTDSTYVAYLVKQLGLRPLAVHLDNGWDSELAVSNIEKVVKALDFDLITHVIDWHEFRELQISFLRASTSDVEIPTDLAINAVLYHVAHRQGVPYVVSGSNYNDEGAFPESWAYGHLDWKYVKRIHRKFGSRRLTTFPHMSMAALLYYVAVKRIRVISILNYVPFNKAQVSEIIQKELGWRPYGGKHYESIYTRFMQTYLLPRKFNIDVRKAYYSSLILRNQMTRECALEELNKPAASQQQLDEDHEYFLKKMQLTEEAFTEIMNAPIKTHHDYGSNYALICKLRSMLNFARQMGWAPS